MNRIWRLVVALLLIGTPAIWQASSAELASAQGEMFDSSIMGPVAANSNSKDDRDDLCGSSNPRKQKKCSYNGWDTDNWNENDNDADPYASGTNGLYVDLWRSNEAPTSHQALMLAVRGDGKPIERVSWWSTGPTYLSPYADDMAHIGEQVYECAGMQPCAWSWTVTPRHDGYYTVYARVRDTDGHEVLATWEFTAVQAP